MNPKPIPTITGQQPPPFNLDLDDDALVTFGPPTAPGTLSFTDAGYMPVNLLTIGGDPQRLQGKLDGLFVKYSGEGTQNFAPNGVPTTADYTSLHFELVGYKGNAAFGHAPDGTATLTGAKHLTVLAQGDLIAGQVGFNATGGLTGSITASYQVDGQTLGTLNLSVEHAAGDIGPAPNGFTLSGGTLHASFLPLPA